MTPEYDTIDAATASYSNIKAEVVAAMWMADNREEVDKILLIPTNSKERPYATEIKAMRKFNATSDDDETYFVIESRTEGLYDMLPEALFHAKFQEQDVSKEAMIQAIQKWRAEEDEMRTFFLPFDSEYLYFKAYLQYIENELDMRKSGKLAKLFHEQYPEIKILNPEQQLVWIYMSSVVKNRRNDLAFFENILQKLLQIKIRVEEVEACTASSSVKMSETKILGLNTVLAKRDRQITKNDSHPCFSYCR